MSDTTKSTSTIDTLVKGFSKNQAALRAQEFEGRVRSFGDTARTIVRDADEPDKRVTEVAIAIIMEFEEIWLNRDNRELKLNQKITLAMENTVALYADTKPGYLRPWQLRHGLSRGEQALYSANNIAYGRATVEGEVEKVKRRITSRIERVKQQAAANKDRKQQTSPSKTEPTETPSDTPVVEKPAAKAPRKKTSTKAKAPAKTTVAKESTAQEAELA